MRETTTSWQAIRDEALRRIRAGDWPPGGLIPGETDLAAEFGCARATVNRALRDLAEAGYLDRRRKAGTRVALNPVRKATLSIPVIHEEVEARGGQYGYALLTREMGQPPVPVRSVLGLDAARRLLHVCALHLSDGAPYALEDRWIDLETIPALAEVDLARHGANAWLVRNMPYTKGSFALAAIPADAATAESLACTEGEALVAVERTTWMGVRPITWVRLCYHPGYRIATEI